MHITSHSPPTSFAAPAAIRETRATPPADPVDSARRAFITRAQAEFRDGTLSAKARELADAAVSPGKVGAPGVQVSTFAVDGAQAGDIVVVKRMPTTPDGPNFILYIPDRNTASFHEFDSREQMNEWLKTLVNDPEQRAGFAKHFSQKAAPQQTDRVVNTLARYAADDGNAVVGSYGYDRGDIFTRLLKDATVPPVWVNGLTQTRLYKIEPDGNATYIGTAKDGKDVIYRYDAYGNLHGAGKNGFYFVKNGLNNQNPLVLMTPGEYARKVTGVVLDNVGANDLSGLYDAFLKQLRNPGEGLATALTALGVPSDVAHSIEAIVTNPISGTLLELNQDNRLGNLFGVDRETMDTALEQIGTELQTFIPGYGTRRQILAAAGEVLETVAPPSKVIRR